MQHLTSNPANLASQEPNSVFVCKSHGGFIPFNQEWRFCDIHGELYCNNCSKTGRVHDPHPLVRGQFFQLGGWMSGYPRTFTCALCNNDFNSTATGPNQWRGFSCLEHNYHVCNACATREANSYNRCVSLQEHREQAHSRRPLTWSLFASTKAQNDALLTTRSISGQGQLRPSSGGSNVGRLDGSFGQGLENRAQAGETQPLQTMLNFEETQPLQTMLGFEETQPLQTMLDFEETQPLQTMFGF